MEHFYQQQQFGEDWFDYQELYSSFVNICQDGSHIVEVGSWKGKSSVYLAVEIINSQKNIKLDCIDTWLGTDNDEYHKKEAKRNKDMLYELFLDNIKPVNHIIRAIRLSSEEASRLYEDNSLEIVFLDADHTYEAVKKDIDLWLPKVKKGGILSGHDYGHALHKGVKKAVDEKLNKVIVRYGTCWIYKNEH